MADFDQLIAEVKKLRQQKNEADRQLKKLRPVLTSAKNAGVLTKEQAQQVGILYGKQSRSPKRQPAKK